MAARNHSCIAAVDQGSFIETHLELASIDCILYGFIVCLRWKVGRGNDGQKCKPDLAGISDLQKPLFPDEPVQARERFSLGRRARTGVAARRFAYQKSSNVGAPP